MAQERQSEPFEQFDNVMGQIAAAKEPYWLGLEAVGCVRDAVIESRIAASAYWLWSELTDRYELEPAESRTVEALMRRAANDWLTTGGDDRARKKYFRRWELQLIR